MKRERRGWMKPESDNKFQPSPSVTNRTVTNAAAGTVATTAVVYDTLGNAVTNETTYGSLTAVTATGYDSQGRVVSQTDALGNAIFTAYDRAGNVTAQWGATYPVAYTYDTAGRRISMRTFRDENDDGDETRWEYDHATGLLTNKVYADGSHVAYTHTQNGKPLRTTWARGAWKENAYDALGQLASVTYSDATPDVYHAYDVFGRVAASSNAVARYEYVNSLSGIATNELVIVDTNTCALTRELGERRRLSALHVGNTPVYYGYDAENRLAVTSNDAFTVAYALTADGWDAGYAVTLANGLSVTRAVTRDMYRRHLITAVSNTVGVSSHSAIGYGYNILGNVTNRNANTFGYNARSEVTGAVIGADCFNYSYDGIGNNIWVSCNAVTNTYTANALNQYTQISVSSVPSVVNPVHDADGNMTWDGRFVHAWDAENRLVRSGPGWGGATNGARRTFNRYDHKSRLVETHVEVLSGRGAGYPMDPSQPGTWDTVETRTFIYDGWLPVLEKISRTGGVTETREHVWGKDLSGTRGGAGGVGGLLATRINDAWYFPIYDNNGNVTDYINESGATVAHREYGPFGETRAASGPMAGVFNFWFSTKYLHHETGFYYYGYRFYSPKLMRWLNRDPIEERGGNNLYCFARNSPVDVFDVNGLRPQTSSDTTILTRLESLAKKSEKGSPDFARAVRAVIADMTARIDAVKGPQDPANLRVGLHALRIWADPALARYYAPTESRATCSKYVAVIQYAGFESNIVPRDDAWWKFGYRYPSASEWFNSRNMGSFRVVWIIQKKDGGGDKTTITWEQPLTGVEGMRTPVFGDIISFPGHVGVYLGTDLYISVTARPDKSGLQPFRLVIHTVPDGPSSPAKRIYFSAE